MAKEFYGGNEKFKQSMSRFWRIARWGVLGLFVLITIFNTVYFVQEDEYAVIRTFGETSVVETSGMKFKIPYVQKIQKVSKASQQFSVGYDIGTGQSIHKESFMITSDYNFVNVDFYFEYAGKKALMEVKGCTLEREGIGYFPDAPTARGSKHIRELSHRLIKMGIR